MNDWPDGYVSESGVGDDNRTAVSDEEVEAERYDAAERAAEHAVSVWPNGPSRDAARSLARIAVRASDARASELHRAARRDVPGGREAEAIVRDLAAIERMEMELLASLDVQRRARAWLASHPLERADSEEDSP